MAKKKIIDPAFKAAQRQNRLLAAAFPSKAKRARDAEIAKEIKKDLPDFVSGLPGEGVPPNHPQRANIIGNWVGGEFDRIRKERKPLKEYYKTRLSHRLDEGRFTK